MRNPIPFLLRLALALLLSGQVAAAHADDENTKAAKIKSAYLLNFVRFTEWPADSFKDEKSPIVIATVGQGAMENVLEDVVAGETANGRPVEIERLQYPTPDPRTGRPDAAALESFYARLKASQLVYTAATETGRVPEIVTRIGRGSVLTVSDAPGFAQAAGMLALVQRDNRIVFEANVEEIEHSRLKVSSKVLKLARVVKSEGNR